MAETGSVWETLRCGLTPELTILILAALVLGVASLICRMIVLTRIFRESFGLGIAAVLFGPVAYIHGWSKAREWGIRNLMIVWTIVSIAGIAVLSWFVVDVVQMLAAALNTTVT